MDTKYPQIFERYRALKPRDNYVMVRHIWLDGNGKDLRSKSNNRQTPAKSVEELPLWGYCGQTCGHMKLTANSDCWLKPVLLCNDPFREHSHQMVFCVPVKYQIEASIHRNPCEKALNELGPKRPKITIRQPYLVVNRLTNRPLGWPFDDFDSAIVASKYGVGANRVTGRDINEAFYRACLYAGLDISGSQVEDLPAMWSFDLGSADGLTIADQIWMARYVLHYIGEQYDCVISFDPLKHSKQSMKVWAEEQTEQEIRRYEYAMNCDPYIAVKQFCQSLN